MTSLRLILSPSCISLRPDGHLHGLTQHVPVISSNYIIAKHLYMHFHAFYRFPIWNQGCRSVASENYGSFWDFIGHIPATTEGNLMRICRGVAIDIYNICAKLQNLICLGSMARRHCFKEGVVFQGLPMDCTHPERRTGSLQPPQRLEIPMEWPSYIRTSKKIHYFQEFLD
jgi:hypothetical protein